MSPFVYLQILRIKNAFRRSFKTPVRGFMSVLLAGYFLFTVMMILTMKEPKVKEGVPPFSMDFPVALLTLAHLIPLLYTIPPPKYLYTIFSETDIANLYQAPLRRWRTFRFFFFARTFAGYCLLFSIFAFYGYWGLRFAVPGIFPQSTEGGDVLWYTLYGVTVLFALAGFLFWRMIFDLRREFKLIPNYLFRIAAFLYLGSIATSLGYHITQASVAGLGFAAGVVQSVTSLPLSILLAPFRVFAQLFLMQAELASASVLLSIAFWIFLGTSGYYVLRAHNVTLYEYAFRLTEFRAQMVTLMKSPAERLKDMKRSGKKVLHLPWFTRVIEPRKAGAIFWLDMVVTWRSFGKAIRLIKIVLFLAVVGGWAAMRFYDVPLKIPAVWRLSALTMLLASGPLSMVSTLGFCEILRRVEIQKPIPISALHTVTMHILQWTAMSCSVTVVPFFTAFILLGSSAYPILIVLMAGWSFMHCSISGFFLISLYNPDANDPIQRMYAMIFGMLVTVVASAPGGVVFAIGIIVHAPLLIILALVISVNLASAAAVHYLSARKYASFVPTE